MYRKESNMAKVQKYSDADFARFESPGPAYNRNAARKIEEVPPLRRPSGKPDMHLVQKKKKTAAEAKREMQLASRKAAKILVISIFLLSMLAALLYSRLRVDELTREVNTVTSQLTEAQGENVRLSMKLDSMISLEHVEEYAENTLGMTKVEGYQMEYIDLSGDDKVMLSGDKTLSADNETSLIEKLKAYLNVE